MPVDLAAADAAAEAVAWLSAHQAVTDALGGPGRVGAYNEPPYPRIRVLDPPGGDDRGLRWLVAPLVQVEALGDLDGTPGKAALRRVLYVALGALAELPDRAAEPGRPVVTAVVTRGGGGWSPLPTSQPRYLGSAAVYIHPPQ